jgi:hypothetical protein
MGPAKGIISHVRARRPDSSSPDSSSRAPRRTAASFKTGRGGTLRQVIVASLVGRTVPTSAKSSQSLILSVAEPLSRQSVARQVSSSRARFDDFHGLAQCHGQARAGRFCVTESDIISEGVELAIKTSLTCGLVMARTAGPLASLIQPSGTCCMPRPWLPGSRLRTNAGAVRSCRG